MSYQEQVERTRRFLDRVEAISSHPGTPIQRHEHFDLEDMIYAFFQNCWHIKDWIRTDQSAPQSLKDAAKNPVSRSDALKLTQAIANGTKHLDPARKDRRFTTNVEIRLEFADSFRHPDQQTTVHTAYTYLVRDEGGEAHSALDVAKQSLRDWEDLIASTAGPIP